MNKFISFVFIGLAFVSCLEAADATIFVERGSVWKFFDLGSAPTNWNQPGFDDTSWVSGAAPLGYGEKGEVTRVNYGANAQNKFITTYFRLEFNLNEIENTAYLVFHLMRDDGAIIYLNGAEMFRSNLPLTAVSSTTLATASVAGEGENYFYQIPVSKNALKVGSNLIAAEIHQNSSTSSDLIFDLELQSWSELPKLAIRPTETQNLEISWPQNPLGWEVFSKSLLDTNGVWLRWSSPASTTNDTHFILVPGADSQRFFRLESQKQP